MKKRIISVVLVIFMISGMLISCGDAKKPAETTLVTAGNSASSEDTLTGEIDSYIAELASENNFSGKTFTWIGEGVETPKVEEETGDIQSDALYSRQRAIEEAFGLEWINYVPEAFEGSYNCGTVDAVIEDVMSGTGAFNAGYGMENPITQPLLSQNVLADLSGLSYVDFNRPWWPDSLLESYTIGSALYLLNGPIVTFYYQDAACVIFNKTVAADYDIPDLYSIVKSGEWTFDKMFEIAEKIPTNQNGTGAYRYGEPDGISILVAHGMDVVKFDSLGKPYVEESLTKELSDLSDKLSPIFSDNDIIPLE